MKLFTLFLLFSSMAFGYQKTIVDESFKSTFSEFGKLEDFLTCSPGYKGAYAVPEVLMLKSDTVGLGFETNGKTFNAYSSDAMAKEGIRAGSTRPRPYNEGCKPAIEKFRKIIEADDTVEITVHRTVISYPSIKSRFLRKRNGDNIETKSIQTELQYELLEFKIGDFNFQLRQFINGTAKEL